MYVPLHLYVPKLQTCLQKGTLHYEILHLDSDCFFAPKQNQNMKCGLSHGLKLLPYLNSNHYTSLTFYFLAF